MVRVNRSFAAIDQQQAGGWGTFGTAGPLGDAMFASPIANFYMTCAISRSSRTMAECIASREAFAQRYLERARRMG
jgi:NADH-quinone oxidoreductase subunit G